jgi:DnaJ-class molecular chaperone
MLCNKCDGTGNIAHNGRVSHLCPECSGNGFVLDSVAAESSRLDAAHAERLEQDESQPGPDYME